MGDRGNVLLRQIDRFFGIPLVFLIGLTVRPRRIPDKINKVGILATAAIGDSLLLSAVLNDLKKAFPETEFTLFCGSSIQGILNMTVKGIEFVTIPVKNPLNAVRIIRKKRFDVFLDCGPWPRLNSFLTELARSNCTIGFNSLGQYRHYGYNIPVEHRKDCHELDNLRRLIQPLGVKSTSLPVLGAAESDRNDAYLVIHMFPSGYKASYKEWGESNWVTLINGVTEKGYNVILTGGPVDKDRGQIILEQCSKRHLIRNEAGKCNLAETGEILRRARLVVSVNTGIMHMAAAYNQALVALHGPTSVLRWGPLTSEAVNLTASSPSAGCLHLGFEYDRNDSHSLDTINPDKVLEAVLKLWDTRNPS
jgi:ADP-heptose:LPS heptosyltransferase